MAIKEVLLAYKRGFTNAHRASRAEETYIIRSDKRDENELDIATYSEVPQKGDLHPRIPGLYATNIELHNDDEAPHMWRAVVTYETPGGSEFEQEINEPDPLHRAPRFNWFTQTIQKATHRTVIEGGDPDYVSIPGIGIGGSAKSLPLTKGMICNSANCLFDPPLMMDETILCLRVTRNEQLWTPSVAYQYGNAMNSDTFGPGISPYQAKMDHITATGPLNDGGVLYWEVEYELHFREDTWFDVVIDMGKFERVLRPGGGSPPTYDYRAWELVNKAVQGTGQFNGEDGPLDGHGAFMRPFDPTAPPTQAFYPGYRCFKLRKAMPFDPLDLWEIPPPSQG